MQYIKVPLHMHVCMCSSLACGRLTVAVCECLPVEGITFILGNDLVGGKVLPALEVLENPSDYPLPDNLLRD